MLSEASSTLIDETVASETVFYQTFYPLIGWLGWSLDFSAWITILVSLLSPSGCITAAFPMFLIGGVDFVDPVVICTAWFQTLSRACWFVFEMVDQANEPYLRWGHMVPSYNLIRIFSFAPQLVPASFHVVANLYLALVSAFWMCGLQVCFLFLA